MSQNQAVAILLVCVGVVAGSLAALARIGRLDRLEARVAELEARAAALDATVCEVDADLDWFSTMLGNRITRTQRAVAGPEVFGEAYSPEEHRRALEKRAADELERLPWLRVPRRGE